MYMVVFDDQQGLTLPMTMDDDCRGALCAWSPGDTVALFHDRKAARAAIDISAKFAALCKAQGTPANDDFLPPCRKFLRIVPCSANSYYASTIARRFLAIVSACFNSILD